jgi:hypothetical protein
MRELIDVAELESWFLVQWPRGERPQVIREFGHRAEAEEALAVSVGATAIRIDRGLRWLQLTLRSSLSMLENAELREALAEWDLARSADALDPFPGTANIGRRADLRMSTGESDATAEP